jgi:hypothetical protein
MLRHPGNLESMAMDMVRSYAMSLLHAMGGQSEDFSALLEKLGSLSSAQRHAVLLLRDVQTLQVMPAGEGIDL